MRNVGALFLLSVASALGAQMADPKSESETLLSAILPFAEQMLEKHGEFFPYGGAMTPDGKIVSVAAVAGTEHPASQDVMNLLQAAFRSGASNGKYKATGMVFDVRTVPPGSTEKTDAIAVALEHKDNYSVVVYFPYKLVAGKVQIGNAFAAKGEGTVFHK